MRIAFLAGTLGRGGAERQLIQMLRALREKGVGARVLCLTSGEAFEKEIAELGTRVDWVGESKNNLVRLKNIVGNLRRDPVDVIQSVHFYTNLYAALAARAVGIPSIGAIRNDLTSEIAANGVFGRWQLKLPRQLIANSQLAVDRALTLGIDRSRLHLVKNAVSAGSDRAAPNDGGRVTLLFAGRLVEQKRPEWFIKLAFELRSRHPELNLRFLVVGDGPLRRSLEHQAASLGLGAGDVSFLGERSDMPAVYRDADILVLTSRHEGTPNVVLEAMANGLPVVAARVGGVPAIVGGEHGIAFDPDDFPQLVDATSTLVVDLEKRSRMGAMARDFVRKNHSISSLQRELTSVYSQIR